MSNTYADVILNINHSQLDRIFQYRIPDSLKDKCKIGMRVLVPFGNSNRHETGYIIGIGNILSWDEDKIKDIYESLDEEQAINGDLILLAKWMKDRYAATLSSCLQCIIPNQVLNKEKYLKINIELNIDEMIEDLTRKKHIRQLEVIKYVYSKGISSLKDIKKDCNVANSVIDRLIKLEILQITNAIEQKKKSNITKENSMPLTKHQEYAFKSILEHIDTGNKSPILLHGITGSGKTEIYLQAIEKFIREGKQAIVLVPEISLTPQMVERFHRRFGDLVEVTHSRLNATERLNVWKKAKRNEISVVLGPRSALFTPFENLGIIVIDEEHELTYKSETSPKYSAIETAVELCTLKNAALVLGSATPSIDSYFKAQIGDYKLIKLTSRISNMLPSIELADMRDELKNGNNDILSTRLKDAIEDRLFKKEQIILFLNRRGHSTFVSCRNCGFVIKCPNCDLPYTFHSNNNKLICHHCGKNEVTMHNCPVCNSKYIKYFGIGTQKVENYIKEKYPMARVLRMDLDTTTRKNSHEKLYKKFKNREADILIGTQMIAKGLDFPFVTLVGVLAADMSLFTSDFRSSERTFQLLTQVAGRAGRSEIKGEVIIQTYSPEHYSIQSALKQDYLEFYKQEIIFRKTLEYPPYTNMLTYLIQGDDEKFVIESAHGFCNLLKHYGESRGFELIGPAPAVLSKINNTYRWRILVKHYEYDKLKNYAVYCLNKYKNYNKTISITFDLNPLMSN